MSTKILKGIDLNYLVINGYLSALYAHDNMHNTILPGDRACFEDSGLPEKAHSKGAMLESTHFKKDAPLYTALLKDPTSEYASISYGDNVHSITNKEKKTAAKDLECKFEGESRADETFV